MSVAFYLNGSRLARSYFIFVAHTGRFIIYPTQQTVIVVDSQRGYNHSSGSKAGEQTTPTMLSLARRLHHRSNPCLHQAAAHQIRHARTDAAASSSPSRRRRPRLGLGAALKKADDKSEWWVVDGEMHEIGENVPLRERFVIPRDNIPNRRRKQLRDQFMRRTRLVIKESVCTPFLNLS